MACAYRIADRVKGNKIRAKVNRQRICRVKFSIRVKVYGYGYGIRVRVTVMGFRAYIRV